MYARAHLFSRCTRQYLMRALVCIMRFLMRKRGGIKKGKQPAPGGLGADKIVSRICLCNVFLRVRVSVFFNEIIHSDCTIE